MGILDDEARNLDRLEASTAAYWTEQQALMPLTPRTVSAIEEFLAIGIPPTRGLSIPGQKVPRRGIKPNCWPLILNYGDRREPECILCLTMDGVLRTGDGRPVARGWRGSGQLGPFSESRQVNLTGKDPEGVEAAVVTALTWIVRERR